MNSCLVSVRRNKTPLIAHENEQLRQRTSTKKTPKNISRKDPNPLAAKRLFGDDQSIKTKIDEQTASLAD